MFWRHALELAAQPEQFAYFLFLPRDPTFAGGLLTQSLDQSGKPYRDRASKLKLFVFTTSNAVWCLVLALRGKNERVSS